MSACIGKNLDVSKSEEYASVQGTYTNYETFGFKVFNIDRVDSKGPELNSFSINKYEIEYLIPKGEHDYMLHIHFNQIIDKGVGPYEAYAFVKVDLPLSKKYRVNGDVLPKEGKIIVWFEDIKTGKKVSESVKTAYRKIGAFEQGILIY